MIHHEAVELGGLVRRESPPGGEDGATERPLNHRAIGRLGDEMENKNKNYTYNASNIVLLTILVKKIYIFLGEVSIPKSSATPRTMDS